jgi:hypothetical protein
VAAGAATLDAPHEGTEKFVSHCLLNKFWLTCVLSCDAGLLRDLLL